MAINRRLLYLGVFFLVTGTVVLVAQGNLLSEADVAAALRLWPVLVIALGVGLLLRRTRFDVAGGMLAAAMPGLLFGGLIVAAPEFPTECGFDRPVSLATQRGTFDGAGVVDLRLACGDVTVTTGPGTAWQTETGNGSGVPPVVRVEPGRLSVATATQRHGFGQGGDVWRLTLPTAGTLDVSAEINAGRGTFALAGARIGSLDVDANAADVRVDLTGATVRALSVTGNAASVSLTLPSSGDVAADVAINAGAIKICAPADLGLRVRQAQETLASISHGGLVHIGNGWESPGYSTAINHADVSVTANVGSVVFNPEGGCK